jgi:hypothetical protein
MPELYWRSAPPTDDRRYARPGGGAGRIVSGELDLLAR